jgi:hypothetical protein
VETPENHVEDSVYNPVVITIEILLVVVAPLIVLYRQGNWPNHATLASLVSIPILWYPSYAPLHELSHVAGTYLVGGSVAYAKLIPSFWLGEFGRAWITTEGVTQNWRQVIMTLSPYILDIVFIALGMFVLKPGIFKKPFILGLVFMLLCLRSAFDFVCEFIAFLSGDRGDFYAIQGIAGSFFIWGFAVFSLIFAAISIVIVLRRFKGFPEAQTLHPGTP